MTTTADAITTLQSQLSAASCPASLFLPFGTRAHHFTRCLELPPSVCPRLRAVGHYPTASRASDGRTQFCWSGFDAAVSDCKLRFASLWADLVNFLPPAIIPGLAVTMLLFPNDRLMPVIFGVGVAICSKVIFRAPVGGGKTQHIFNPSNLGIVATLFLFPSIGSGQPAITSTENLTGMWHRGATWLRAGDWHHRPCVCSTGRLTLVI